ncbi:hypothetical protein PWT90_06871 [Aphanocladium album]|nr:hypothetical protein PWT90_06871 [Aphanocladium album]
MLSQAKTSVTLVAALATLANAHSWVEEVYRIAPNGTMVGDVGYPRGWVARTSTNPVWKDAIPQWLLPVSGQSAYSGDEILNKYEFNATPAFPMLQAAAGDHVALIHLENGHTTLPQNQPKKPHNRGTIFFYGTADPKPQERLFDVHLVWNRDGTGGDKRGKLLGTRNYDDGQCYQPNPGPISNQRAQELAGDGAVHDRELRCQSDIQLPADLKPGSTYTIYWYWDWPDLNAANIDMAKTTNGIYPWAGTFMRGEKDPHGFTMAAIARNESYASTVDIKIVERAQGPGGAVAKAAVAGSAWQADQNIYTKAIKEQMGNNFQVDIDANQPAGGNDNNNGSPSSAPGSSAAPSSAAPTDAPGEGGVTVTKTVTVPPSTVISTVYVTKSTESSESSPSSSSLSQVSQPPVYATVTLPASSATATSTVTSMTTIMVTVTKHVQSGTAIGSGASPSGTLALRNRAVRRDWRFGQ